MLKATLLKAAGSPSLKRLITRNPVARRVAGRFIAGDTLDEAERAIRTLNDRGVSVALDYLGENTESEAQARESTGAYLAALDRIQEGGLDANISVKLTAMGLDLRQELALEEATRVASRGKEVGAMVGVDMESNVYVDRTLDIVEALKGSYDNVGVCLQSYLYRTRDDLDRLNRVGVPVRLTKALVAKHRRDRDTFEFQMLYGVRRDLQEEVVAEGYRLRVYVPYGTQWFPYFMRRLAERPANLYFFASNLVKR